MFFNQTPILSTKAYVIVSYGNRTIRWQSDEMHNMLGVV